MALYVEEQYVAIHDDGKRYGLGDSGVYETSYDTPGKLFLNCQRHFGRCGGYVYIDDPDGNARKVGWVFHKRMPFEDMSDKTYMQEVWVTVREQMPEVSKTNHYHYLG